ncbi:hypothetical protein [Jeotgalibacillus proteolyticus]|nr:hypothetical protein [Jeotgalibacillus proteolyticus]
MKWVDDLAGAIYDFFKQILTGLSYFVAGTLIVGIPLYFIAKAAEIIGK